MTIKESLQFERNLYNLINSCGLPMYTAYYVLKSVFLDFERTMYEYANTEGEGFVTETKVATDPSSIAELEIDTK